uniref:flagellar hook-length control protein FliK n=1 Tax=Burkholderia ubonensis TaxID=101571 RepID=UPI000F5898F8|nr:flagellar hook-length control protein FliK [Burkholderia ubonensis]RQP27783.1 flagellar hook-length control protein FliK [Burkholderia ubonensis]RQP30410.1 flagellar hook-length control protein FliK [Burkholderia ubonensis]RQP46462.1 flagellar hook-length control protein FliK [Burkholderia ubonensis]RQP47945.1 flagellar hook-length control protein FliK [Burkholderia ubonensis]RQP51597.1 flagellar hook-length control protein FliK [Burkholderia ubonensis]
MSGIDTVAAALLASRLDSLLTGVVSPPSGGGAAAQVGAQATGASAAPAPPVPPAAPIPQASAQTALSDVGLVLDAISRFGGDATPAVVGRTPLLADPTVLLADPAAQAPGGARAAVPPDASRQAALPSGQAASSAQAVRDASAAPPVVALRAALAQAVSESGLFYESHLAQWLAGQRPLAALAREPQARLLAPADAHPPAADSVLDDLLDARLPLPSPAPRAAAQQAPGQGTPAGAPPRLPAHDFLGPDAVHARGAGAADARLETADSRWPPARAALADTASSDAQGAAPVTVHPAAVPLVRQQLDVLATDQFRWIGEAWPGARLDWTIEPDDSGGHAARGDDAGDGIAWRTRLTLTLPSLGTVDAELVLNGEQLVARLRANEIGAGRLARHEGALRQRLEASGLQLGGLSIRAVDGAPDGFDAVAAKAAAAAYARGGGADDGGAR